MTSVEPELPKKPNSATATRSSQPVTYMRRLAVIIPALFCLGYLCHIRFNVLRLDRSFFFSIALILLLSAVVDELNARLRISYDKIDGYEEQVKAYHKTFEEASKRLQNYKDGYDRALKKRGEAQARTVEALKDLTECRDDYIQRTNELTAALEQNITDFRVCRKDVNDIRLRQYKSMLEYQDVLIGELDKLVKKFKNVAVPKVKGVSPRKQNSNSLTGPLEKLLAVLKNERATTERQIAIVEKIGDILSEENGDVKTMYEEVRKAERMLESAGSAGSASMGVDSGASAAGAGAGFKMNNGMEVNLEEQYARLDKYFQSIAAPAASVEEVKSGEVEAEKTRVQ